MPSSIIFFSTSKEGNDINSTKIKGGGGRNKNTFGVVDAGVDEETEEGGGGCGQAGHGDGDDR